MKSIRALAGQLALRGNLVNAALFQVNWFACVLGGAAGQSGWALPSLGLLALQAARGDSWRCDLALVAAAVLCGAVLDTLWIRVGILHYGGAETAPVWIVMMWAGVALTLNRSLGMFRERPWLGGLLAAASAPLCYLGGQRLGGVEILSSAGLAVIGAAWLAVFVAAFELARRASLSPVSRAPSDPGNALDEV